MEAKLVQHTVVVTGDAHNPTILNPDFLQKENIVPKAWGWTVEQTLTTPPLALVRFDNGVSITVEPGKVQVADPSKTSDPLKSKAADIATAYVNTLRHVRYTAVGINFLCTVDDDSPERFVKNRFLKDGSWLQGDYPLETAGLRLVYKCPFDARLTLSVDTGQSSGDDEADKRPVLIVRGNFHRESTDETTYKKVSEFLANLAHDWDLFQKLIVSTLGFRGGE